MKRSFWRDSASFFVLLSILFIPFPFHLSNLQTDIDDFLFGRLVRFVKNDLLSVHGTLDRIISDSLSLYLLVGFLLILALIIGMVISRTKKWPNCRDRFLRVIYILGCYYLVLFLLKYGVDKIFKNQFYLPEPNILYTPLGKMSKGLIYWSSMGTSHFYNVFLGLMEVIPAVLIFFRRTRLAGLILSFFVLVNVVAVNFGFDISVKLFSVFLLFLNLYLLYPFLENLYHYFFSDKTIAKGTTSTGASIFQNKFLYGSLKCLMACLILVEVLFPYLRKGNFNGDLSEKPYLHGAYEVKRMIVGADTLDASHATIKRFFINKDSYMIFQDQEDNMNDYKLAYDLKNYVFVITDYGFHKTVIRFDYQPKDSMLDLEFFKGETRYRLEGKAINWRELPAVKKRFHWTIDNRR